MKILKLYSLPSVGHYIHGYGIVERIQRIGMHTYTSFAKIGNETIIIEPFSLSSPGNACVHKKIFFAKLPTKPVTGQQYEMYRYDTLGNPIFWKKELVLSAPLIGVKELWHNMFYAESKASAYYLYVEE